MRMALLVATVVAAGSVTAILAGIWWWQRRTAATVDHLKSAIVAAPPRHSSGALAAVPLPVARYFRKVLRDGQPSVRSAIATQHAEFFINGGWRSLDATQHFTASAPGFVWDATIDVAFLLPAYVRDAYVAGRGSMQATIYGLYPLANQAGTPELNAGALQRFLGEAVWFPTALLSSPALTWTARDDFSATATLRDHDTSVSLLFEFDDTGDVLRISGDRYKEAAGKYLLQPWVIECREHAFRGGMRIPLYCEVAWIGADGAEPYWRGRIATIDYEFWR